MDDPLEQLFAPAAASAAPVSKRFRVLRKQGELLLALPLEGQETAAALELYPAQRPLARLLKRGLRTLARLHLPLPLGSLAYPIARDAPFALFLDKLAPGWAEPSRGLALLAGNPRAAGRRFVLLLFQDGRPVAVVKAGVTPDAQTLVRREAGFLQATPRAGIEVPRATFFSDSIAAFALPWRAGTAPRSPAPAAFRRILEGWLDAHKKNRFAELPAWARLSKAAAGQAIWPKLAAALAEQQVSPAIVHGDFAPWNIKVHPATGAWQVFDWERAERIGVPGWDWLHFEIQTGLLVRRETAPAILARLERLFAAPDFRAYAESASLVGLERPVALAYLLHCATVQRQTEGAAELESLLHEATRQWNV